MSGPAQVRSTDAIDALRAALARFQQRVQNALDSLDGELRRAGDWIEHDRPGFWRREIHLAEDQVHTAKIELERCLTFTVGDERPTCREQQAALKEAKARLEYCREKAEALRAWQRTYRHEQFEYDGRIGQLRRVLEQELPRSRAVLETIIRRLDEYRIEQAPAFNPMPGDEATRPGPAADGAHRRGEAPATPDGDAASAPAEVEFQPAPPEPLEER